MPRYDYEAVDDRGRPKTGNLAAADEAAARALLSERGLTPYSLKVAEPAHVQAAANGPAARLQARPGELAFFFRQFAALVKSGMSPALALDSLAGREPVASIRAAAIAMKEGAQDGTPISQTMGLYPGLFADHVVSTVRAGETGGFLEIVLDEIAYEYEQETALYRGLALPKSLVLQELVAVALAQPVFPTLFPNLDYRLLALYMVRNLLLVAGGLLAGRWWLRRLGSPAMAERRDAILLRLPVFGDLVRQKSLAAFIRMLRRLFHAGLLPIHAWEGAMHTAPNAVVRARLAEAYELVRQGIPLQDAFAATHLFAGKVEQLVATGIEAGQIVPMLDQAAEYYQESVGRAYGRARFTLWRIAVLILIILGGWMMIMMTRGYFDAILQFGESFADG